MKQMFNFALDGDKLEIQRTQSQLFCSQFSTMCSTAPDFFIRSSSDISILVGHRLLVELVSWDPEQYNGTVSFRKDLGEIGVRDVEAAAIFIEHGVRTNDLEVKELLDELPQRIIDDSVHRRVDLIDAPVCSVDPPGCKDVDDALHYRRVNDALYNKMWKSWMDEQVHIDKVPKEAHSRILKLLHEG